MDAWEDDADAAGDDELRDFGYGGKDATIFLVDASKAMRVKLEGKEEEEEDKMLGTPLQLAVAAVEVALKAKVFQVRKGKRETVLIDLKDLCTQ